MNIQQKKPVKSFDQSILVKNDVLNSFYAPHHYHEDYEIIYIKKSQGIKIIGNCVGNYQTGEVVILGPRVPHYHELGFMAEPDEFPIETIAVLFPESIFTVNNQFPEFNQTRMLLESLKFGIELVGSTREKIKKILETMTLVPSFHNFVSLFRILEEIKDNANDCVQLSTITFDNMRLYDEKTKHVLNYISEHFQEKISVGMVAEVAGMSLSGFCVFFKSQTSYTFSNYLNMLRVSKACELLATTKLSITDVAFEVGYDNLAYFNRKFKEFRNCTPKSFRSDLTQKLP